MSEIDTTSGSLFPTEDSPISRLHDAIQLAVAEISRLREENASLQDQLKELEASVQSRQDLFGGSPPEELKEQIEGFINTIDSVLAEQKTLPRNSK